MSTILNINISLRDNQSIRAFAFAKDQQGIHEIGDDLIQKQFYEGASGQSVILEIQKRFEELGFKIQSDSGFGVAPNKARFTALIKYDPSKGGLHFQHLVTMVKVFPKAFPHLTTGGQ